MTTLAIKDRLRVCLVATTPDYSRRERQISLAPYVLKRYADVHLEDTVDIRVFDYETSTPLESVADGILAMHPQVVGFSCYVWNHADLLTLGRLIKARQPSITTVFGGPMFSADADLALRDHAFIDVACHETTRGEISFIGLLRAWLKGAPLSEVPGIAYRLDSGQVAMTGRRSEAVDRSLAVSPILSGDLPIDQEKGSFVTIETTRGCPFDCAYCGWGDGKVEFFPMKRILAELERLYNAPNVRFVLFGDSNMALNKPRLLTIIDHLQKQSRFREIDTYMYLYVTSLDGDLVKRLSIFPNFVFSFGMQTANPDSLSLISSRRPGAARFKAKVDEIRKSVPDFKFSLDLLLGLPGDTLDGFRKTLDVCFSLEPERLIIVYPVFLLPGSRFYRDKDALKLEYTRDHPQALISTPTFPRADIEQGMRLAIWTLIVTTYYPAISRVFRQMCQSLGDGERVALIESWARAVDGDFDSFKGIRFTDAAATAFKTIKGLQRDMLKHFSQAKSALRMYRTLDGMPGLPQNARDALACGIDVFEAYHRMGMDPCGKEAIDAVPESVRLKYGEKAVADAHSIYRI